MAVAAADWVEAGPFRAHLRHLMEVSGLSSTELAVLTGVPPRMAGSLARGRAGRPVRRISAQHARALLQVRADDVRSLRDRQIPAGDSRLRLQRLVRARGGIMTLAPRLGVTVETLDDLADTRTMWCSALLALRLLVAARTAPGAVDGPVEVWDAAA